ncbi:MAG: hypothetical protein JEY91_02985 [Spirochaetaceae bacterium]|nr:hypothetical protein [Spirochaetaceae bacterium]
MLKDEEMAYIGEYVKSHLNDWLGQTNVIPFAKQLEISERITRVETEIKGQNEQIKMMLDTMNKRFEQVDKRFEQVDKRFSQMFAYFTTSFVIIATLMSVYQFVV